MTRRKKYCLMILCIFIIFSIMMLLFPNYFDIYGGVFAFLLAGLAADI